MKIIEINGVDHVFADGTMVLQNISLSIEEGVIHFITGPSGSGKTTLLNLLLGLYRPSHGEILINGQNICALSDQRLTLYRQQVGTIFQQNNLIPHRNVFENVAMPLWLRGKQRKEVHVKVSTALEGVGLANYERELPMHLSSGEQQRVAIARALVAAPHIVVADEPTGNLDRSLAERITELLRNQTHVGVTVIMVTHDENLIRHNDSFSRLVPNTSEAGATTLKQP